MRVPLRCRTRSGWMHRPQAYRHLIYQCQRQNVRSSETRADSIGNTRLALAPEPGTSPPGASGAIHLCLTPARTMPSHARCSRCIIKLTVCHLHVPRRSEPQASTPVSSGTVVAHGLSPSNEVAMLGTPNLVAYLAVVAVGCVACLDDAQCHPVEVRRWVEAVLCRAP